MTNISIFIITVQNSRNFDNLVESLVQNFGVYPSILLGVTPKDLPCFGTATHVHKGKYRPLSCHEVAAALSHSRARELALTQGNNWNIFLEDDSELIQTDISDFIANLLQLPSGIPFFLHLFPEQNGILIRSKYCGMKSICKMPDYANAYAFNAEGLKLFLKNTNRIHLYLADWPTFPSQIKKVAPKRSIFRHPFQSIESSLISNERMRIQAHSRAFTLNHRIKHACFRIFRIPLRRVGSEKIASENLRSVDW